MNAFPRTTKISSSSSARKGGNRSKKDEISFKAEVPDFLKLLKQQQPSVEDKFKTTEISSSKREQDDFDDELPVVVELKEKPKKLKESSKDHAKPSLHDKQSQETKPKKKKKKEIKLSFQ